MSKLVLIDGNNIIHRAYYALPSNLTTRNGEPINAIYGFVSMLLRIITDLKPTHIAICFDRNEPTFRKQEFANYQVQRKPTDDELKSQFVKARDVAHAFSIPVYEMSGFEADDLMGTLAIRAVEGKVEDLIDEVVIVSGDRDIFQLVNDKVKVFFPIRGLSEGKLFGMDDVIEKMGVPPKKIVDYKALVGDASDNYKGVPGIGPKTAINLLEKYGSFEKIYENLEKIPESTKKKLIKGKESGELSLRLAKIITNMDIDVDLSLAKRWQVDGNQVLDLFAEYGFRTLTKRVKEVGKSVVSENQGNLF